MAPKFTKEFQASIDRGTYLSTVESTIQRVFPLGTEDLGDKPPSWVKIPLNAADVFAVTGILLEDSGAFAFHGVDHKTPHMDFPKLALGKAEMDACLNLGSKWIDESRTPPAQIQKLWDELMSYGHFPLSYRAYRFAKPKKRNNNYWWSAAHKLFVIADHACARMGYSASAANENTIAGDHWRMHALKIAKDSQREGRIHHIGLQESLTDLSDPDVVCVQPKSLVPRVGAGTRVFSENLALLRSRGLVRTQWLINDHRQGVTGDSGINILAIPFPYEFGDDEFITKEIHGLTDDSKTRVFRLKQTWLQNVPFKAFKAQVKALISECMDKHDKPIHAIVLPELALNQKRFLEFAKFVKNLAPELEFIVSGTSENCQDSPKEGNYIWIRKFKVGEDGVHAEDDGFIDISQSKHHRWNLNGAQIRDYRLGHGVGGGLDESAHWENFAGRPRELNFVAYRQRSCFCGIICEDLARSEPAHEIIRAIGPNLLFALLMDGPQIAPRWGARYSSMFSDDHGCAVMTLSSLALVAASNKKRAKKNHSVLYFRSPNMSEAESFEGDGPGSAVLVRLVPDRLKNNESPFRSRELIDGRKKNVIDWIIDPQFAPLTITGAS